MGVIELDYLEYCKILQINVHPGFVFKRELQGDVEVDVLEIRGWKVDSSSVKAFGFALRACQTLRTVR